MKVIDLFCGAGGFSEGFRQAGFNIILGIDIWDDALESFARNHKCDALKADIKDIDYLPDCDIIIGSPPCQNFSSLNTKKKVSEGLKLIHQFERIIKLNKPKYWVWENVPFIKKFYPHATILNSWDFGLSQRRKRAFIANFSFLQTNHKEGIETPVYNYSGSRAESISRSALAHRCRSGTVRTKPIRNLETNQFLSMNEVKELMGFPIDYEFCGNLTSQRKQLGNAVCPPVAKVIAEGLISESLCEESK